MTTERENMNVDIMDLLDDAREEQRRAIVSRAPLTVVSAGAGTGKTHTLARRFAWLLASDPTCGVDQILTLTFTQAAATEMRERIRTTLVEWHASRPQRLAHLRDAIERLDEGYISTIHAFALRVIRESGLDLDLDPAAGLVSSPLERDFWSDFEWSLRTMSASRIAAGVPEEMNAFARETLADPDFPAVLEHYGAATVAKLASAAGETFGSMMISPSAFARFDEEREASIRKRIANAGRPCWQEVWDAWFGVIFPAIEDELTRGDNALARALAKCRAKWLPLGRDKSDECACGFYAELMLEGLADLKARKLKGRIEEVLGASLTVYRKENALQAEVSAALCGDDAYAPGERTVRRLLLAAAAIGWGSWESAKRRMGVLSFSDLVAGASSVLRGNATYAARFRHIMIDEFQDTDSLQDSLIVSLREGWASAADGDDRDKISRTLFIVGDIKQSIYRFRHARPDLFAGYIGHARAEAACEFIPLMRSYRMSGRVMGAINAIFERVWADGVTKSSQGSSVIDYEPLLPPDDLAWWTGRNGDDATNFPLEILVCRPASEPKDGEAEKIGELRKKLAREIANRIVSVACEENIWDKKEGIFRKANWGDFAVLVPKRTGAYPALEDAFAAAGIPAAFEGGREYFNRGEVQDVVNLLRLLADPEDDYALAGWLESPLSGVAPGPGLALAEEAERERVSFARRFTEEFPDAAARLDHLRRKALLCGASDAILDLLEEDGWIAAYRPEARERVVANLRHAVDIAREFEASMGRSLAACADYLGREMRAFAPSEEPESVSIGDAVRVMTVHASKGLEFPIVVLMGMEATPRSRSGRERAQISGPVGVVFSKLPSGEHAHSAARHKFLDSLEEWEEYERQMYVAMTRAQEKLICAGIATREHDDEDDAARKRSWLEWLLYVNESRKLGFPTTEITDTPEKAEDVRQRRHAASAPETGGIGMRIFAGELAGSRVMLSRLSASAYSLFSWCPYAYRLRYRQGLELKWELPDGDGYGGADLGSLAHWVLTHWDFDAETLAAYLPGEGDGRAEVSETELRTVPPYLRHVYRSTRNREVLRTWLSAFAGRENAGLFRCLRQGKRLRQEVQFRVPFSGMNLIGGIDVYWEDEAGIHIRDWKITREEQSVHELYDEQIRFYALACHLLHPDVRIDAGLLHLRPGEEDYAAMEIIDWEKLSNDVRRMAETAISGPFEMRVNRCGRCPFRGVCYTATGTNR